MYHLDNYVLLMFENYILLLILMLELDFLICIWSKANKID